MNLVWLLYYIYKLKLMNLFDWSILYKILKAFPLASQVHKIFGILWITLNKIKFLCRHSTKT